MSLSHLIFWATIIVIILIFIFFPGARALLKGFIGIFIKDLATTPDGAAAIYREKIEEEQDRYNTASTIYNRAAGKLSMARKHMEELQVKLKKVESECETLVKNNKMDAAALKAEERDEVLSEIRRTDTLIKTYVANERDAKEAYEACEKSLRDIKKEAKEVVDNMRVKEQIKESYEEMDDLKRVRPKDQLIDDIRDKNKDLNAEVEGARAVHESKLSTRLSRAEAEAKKSSSNDYLEQLKNKYKR